jgi:hypothetical protein
MRNVTISKIDGDVLARAVLSDVAGGPKLSIDKVVAGKGRLLHHYFGQGLRSVRLESGDFQLNGSLSTQWCGSERRWFVELRPIGRGPGTAAGRNGGTNER